MSEDDNDESPAKSIYKSKRRRYYFEGILVTTTIALALLVAQYGLSVQVVTSSKDMIAMYGSGLIASAVMAVRITRGLPGLGLRSTLVNALVASFVSAFTVPILGILLLIPIAVVGIPLSIGLDLVISRELGTPLALLLSIATAFGVAAVFTAAAVSITLSDNEKQQFSPSSDQQPPRQQDVAVQTEQESVENSTSTSGSEESREGTTPTEATSEVDKQLKMAVAYLEKSESRISEGDIEMGQTQLSRAENHLTRATNETSSLPDRYDNLRRRAESLDSLLEQSKEIISYLDTAEDCLDSASSYLESNDTDAAKQQVATAKGRLTRFEDAVDGTILPRPERYDSLRSRCDSLETSIKETYDRLPLEEVIECLDSCESSVEENNIETARNQLNEAATYLGQIEQSGSQTSDQYDQLRTRYEGLQASVDELENIGSRLDTITECLEDAASDLDAAEHTAAANKLATANEQLMQIEAVRDELSVSLLDRYEEVQARYDEVQGSRDSLDRALSLFDTAADCLETTASHMEQDEFEAAKKQLSTAKGRLTRAENELGDAELPMPDRYATLRARCETIADTIETEQRRVEADKAVTTAVDAMDAGYEAYEAGDLSTAASKFDTVSEHLPTVHDLSVDAQALSLEMSPDTITAESARGRIRVEMQRAEQLVTDGHDAIGDRDYATAVKAYEDALSKLRTATGIATEHGLPQSWELDQRQSTIANYLDNAKGQRDATDEQRSETTRHRLDRAVRLAETAEQHLEVDDTVAAREDIQQAQDVVGDALELIAGIVGETTSLEQKASECTERIDRIAGDIPDQTEEQIGPGTASKRDLLTYLQDLSVIFGESPRAEFIEEYGIYPASAYFEVFGSWEAALDEANLTAINNQARERRVYSRAAILDAIIDLADEVGGVPTPDQMNNGGTVSTATVEKRFDSWSTAVQLAGLDGEITPDTVSNLAGGSMSTTSVAEDKDAQATSGTDNEGPQTATTGEDTDGGPSRADLIAALQQIDPDRGYPLTTTMREDGPYNPEQYYSEFGSWDDALEAAEIDKQERLLAEIRRVADIVGHPPTTTEMNKHSVHSSGTYSSAFPSWEAALQEVDLPDSVTETPSDEAESTDTGQPILEHFDWLITLDEVKDNSRLAGPIVVKIMSESSATGEKKDANFHVEDLDGGTAWFNVWSTHNINVAWELGHWYVLENARGKTWTSGGQQKRALSSTRDLEVTDLGTTRPTAGSITSTTETKTTTSGATGDAGDHIATDGTDVTAESEAQETTETVGDASDSAEDDEDGDILDDLMEDFEDL